MAVAMKVAATIPSVNLSPATHQTLTAASLRRFTTTTTTTTTTGTEPSPLLWLRHRSPTTPPPPTGLIRTRSLEFPKPRFPSLRRSLSASTNSFSSFPEENNPDDDDDDDDDNDDVEFSLKFNQFDYYSSSSDGSVYVEDSEEEEEETTEGLTVQWKDESVRLRDAAYCSMKKAFSTMVFMIREVHGFTLQMRELLYYEDLQDIWVRVQKEMHASFVWLFQQVFSHTPTLMVYVMIFLANFTVLSMSSNAAFASAATLRPIELLSSTAIVPSSGSSSSTTTTTRAIMVFDAKNTRIQKYEGGGGKTLSIGGINGGGGNARRHVGNGTEGEGWFDQLGVQLHHHHQTIVPDGVSQVSTFGRNDQQMVTDAEEEKEEKLWNAIVDEAARMQAEIRDESLDSETVINFVSPVTAAVEEEGDDHYGEYFKTEMMYQIGLAQDPNNSLLLANYAQFLYVVLRDYNRAEDYFKRAVKVEPKDAEACNKYANFLWQVKNDLWAAEETFLEAISAEPDNSFYAANYAHFLWNTGGEDTCYPIDGEC